ncbi:hypothetical protein FIBSPDRAFT_897422 [Athelia psychrophila]|uniref:Uncharacterized protein n=1 Tax=Athelia psychrophila TaxID=1759441 RepID=A0A166C7W5_9AGAM|nr:hypothetical protein FIBSPDRAFT_897422 [Fibularhizoctonia sp. CBS 109695]
MCPHPPALPSIHFVGQESQLWGNIGTKGIRSWAFVQPINEEGILLEGTIIGLSGVVDGDALFTVSIDLEGGLTTTFTKAEYRSSNLQACQPASTIATAGTLPAGILPFIVLPLDSQGIRGVHRTRVRVQPYFVRVKDGDDQLEGRSAWVRVVIQPSTGIVDSVFECYRLTASLRMEGGVDAKLSGQ